MEPYCCCCFTMDPEPVKTDTGDYVFWFKLQQDMESMEDDICTIGLNDNGEVSNMFLGIPDKDFEYDESFKIMCPGCVIKELEDEGIIDSFEEYEDFDDEDEENLF